MSETTDKVATCLVCWDNLATVVMVPCGHMCLCKSCRTRSTMKLMKKKCPICRIEVDRTVSVKKAENSMQVFVPFLDTPSASKNSEIMRHGYSNRKFTSKAIHLLIRIKRRVRPLKRVME